MLYQGEICTFSSTRTGLVGFLHIPFIIKKTKKHKTINTCRDNKRHHLNNNGPNIITKVQNLAWHESELAPLLSPLPILCPKLWADITLECSLTIPTVSPNVVISGEKTRRLGEEHVGVKSAKHRQCVFKALVPHKKALFSFFSGQRKENKL